MPSPLRLLPRSAVVLLLALLLALATSACGDDGGADPSPPTGDGTSADASDATDASLDSDGSAVPTGTGSSALPPRPWSVHEDGPFNTGFRSWNDLTYLPRGHEEERALNVRVWYPTLDTEGRLARYARNLLARRNVPVFAGATLAEEAEDRMPLLIFSHGNSGVAEQNWTMMEFFASHGWVVVSPDHTGNTFFDDSGSINLRSAVVRPQDISRIIDHVEDLPADDPLHGRIDMDAIVISGHSFGGFTSLAVTGAAFGVDELIELCEDPERTSRFCVLTSEEDWIDVFREGFLDERVAVSVPLTPGGAEAFHGGTSAITAPTMLMTGGRDLSLPNEREGDPIWDGMVGSQHIRLDFTTAGHFTFSNMCELFGAAVPDDGCNEANMAYDEAFRAINAYSLAFARLHLFGDETNAALLNGEEIVDSRIVYMRKD